MNGEYCCEHGLRTWMHAERTAFDVFVSITTAIGHAPVEMNQGNATKSKTNSMFNTKRKSRHCMTRK
jgi:hypothetical protein